MNDVTFVTAFIGSPGVVNNRTTEWRMKYFDLLGNTGINICVYCDANTLPLLEQYATTHQNVKVMSLNHTDIEIYKMCMDSKLTMPSNRNVEKDTNMYMGIMNSKIAFVHDAIQKNPWNSDVFAWIDFSIAYIFKDPEGTLDNIKKISSMKFVDKFISIPGCRLNPIYIDKYLNCLCWRFCGGFFIGDKESLTNFYEASVNQLPIFFAKYNRLLWEVNIWAWLEETKKWEPTWFLANHNDSMFNLPASVIKPLQ